MQKLAVERASQANCNNKHFNFREEKIHWFLNFMTIVIGNFHNLLLNSILIRVKGKISAQGIPVRLIFDGVANP